MQEQQYFGDQQMINNPGMPGDPNGSNGIGRFFVGLLSGIAAATPIVALITKKICDKEKNKAVAAAVEEAETRGIQAGMQVAVENMSKQPTTNPGTAEQINGNVSAAEDKPKFPQVITHHGEPIPVYLEKTPMNEAAQQSDFMRMFEANLNNGNKSGEVMTGNEAYLASLQAPEEDPNLNYDLEDYDLTIDDEEATKDAQEFSEEHVRYLDMIQHYKNQGGDVPPMTISREQFENEHFYQKSYVNWYEEDDIFEEEDTKIDDPAYLFGFTSGREMFAPERTANREDPDICHIRNMQTSTDFEVTRMHGSYERLIQNGEVYYHGEANPIL